MVLEEKELLQLRDQLLGRRWRVMISILAVAIHIVQIL